MLAQDWQPVPIYVSVTHWYCNETAICIELNFWYTGFPQPYYKQMPQTSNSRRSVIDNT